MRILAAILTAFYVLTFFGCLADWVWVAALPPIALWAVFGFSLPIAAAWLVWGLAPARRGGRKCWAAATLAFLLWWPAAVFSSNELGRHVVQATIAQVGAAFAFIIGMLWTIWLLERAAQHFRRRRLARAAAPSKEPPRERTVWNPLDLEAWYYGISPRRWHHVFTRPFDSRYWQHNRSRRLDQSFAGILTYSALFLLVFLLLTSMRGCGELYEMPAGGGEQQTIAQVVRVQKIIRKKFIVNPFSAISFNVPPIDEVKLQLTEVTHHAYTVGYGEGEGAGFAGGTNKGKVRFIRLKYAGGDWDQDHGVGGDMNMLFEYGLRTQHRVAERTESRTITQLQGFPPDKSPPVVYLTGQKSISVSNSEVKTLREYLNEKHGMIFADNGGSAHFHNQFLSLMNRVEPGVRPVPIPLDDVIHKVPFQIPFLPYVAPHGGKEALGWWKNGRWICYYHPGDIGDAWSDGHAGVDREVHEACYQLGSNVIFYAHAEYSKWLEAKKKSD